MRSKSHQQQMSENLPGTLSSVMPRSLLLSWLSPYRFQIMAINPLFLVKRNGPGLQHGRQQHMHPTDYSFTPTYDISALILNILAAFPPLNFLTGPLTSAIEGGASLTGWSVAVICNPDDGHGALPCSTVQSIRPNKPGTDPHLMLCAHQLFG